MRIDTNANIMVTAIYRKLCVWWYSEIPYNVHRSNIICHFHVLQIWENGLRKSAKSQTLQASSINSLIVNGDVIVNDADVRGQLRTLFDRIVTKSGNHTITGNVYKGLHVLSNSHAAT